MSSQRPSTSLTVILILLAWGAAAWALGAFGVVAQLRPPFPQVVLFGLVGALLLAYLRVTRFRDWLTSIHIGWLVAVHLVRFVGFYFLLLYVRRELPFAFAVPGGLGDVCVATLAVLVLAARTQSRVILGVWNTLGSLDILFVVFTAARLALVDPASMAALLKLPLSLLPTFIVPVIIFSHVVIYVRLRKRQLGA